MALASILANLIMSESPGKRDARDLEQYKKKQSIAEEAATREREILRQEDLKNIEKLRQNGLLPPEHSKFDNETLRPLYGKNYTASNMREQLGATSDISGGVPQKESGLRGLSLQSALDRERSYQGANGPNIAGQAQAAQQANELARAEAFKQQQLAEILAREQATQANLSIATAQQGMGQLPLRNQLFESGAQNDLLKNQVNRIPLQATLDNGNLYRDIAVNGLRNDAFSAAYGGVNPAQSMDQPYLPVTSPQGLESTKNPLYRSPFSLAMEGVKEMGAGNGSQPAHVQAAMGVFGAPASPSLPYNRQTAPPPPRENSVIARPALQNQPFQMDASLQEYRNLMFPQLKVKQQNEFAPPVSNSWESEFDKKKAEEDAALAQLYRKSLNTNFFKFPQYR
jgi:hypothetical protein